MVAPPSFTVGPISPTPMALTRPATQLLTVHLQLDNLPLFSCIGLPNIQCAGKGTSSVSRDSVNDSDLGTHHLPLYRRMGLGKEW